MALFNLFFILLITFVTSSSLAINREDAIALLCDTIWWKTASLENVDKLIISFGKDEARYFLCGVDNNSLLHLAAISTPYTEVIEYLLGLGFFTWRENKLGQTPTHMASANIYPDILRTLQNFLRNDNYDRKLYVGFSIGMNSPSRLGYSIANQDTTCYPDALCFTNNSPSPISEYLWFYDMQRNPTQSLEFFTGLNLRDERDEKLRVEFAFTTQKSTIYHEFNGMKYDRGENMYSSNSDINLQSTVQSNTTLNISDITTNAFIANVYSEFGDVFSQNATPFIGIGMGTVLFSVNEINFTTNYQDIANPSRDLSSYNSSTSHNVLRLVPTVQFHTGLDFNTNDRIIFGVKFTASYIGRIGHIDTYSIHPMQDIHPNVFAYEEFNDMINLRAAFVIKWRR